jgi:hypothetical protein
VPFKPAMPQHPTKLSVTALFDRVTERPGKAASTCAILIVIFAGIMGIVESAKGVHLHWLHLVMPTIEVPAFSAVSGSAITLTVIGTKKVIKKMRQASPPTGETQTSTNSSQPSSGPGQTPPTSR